MTKLTKPMLAAKYDPAKTTFPLWGSVKVDGIRCLIRDGVALSRSLKPIPNRHVQEWARLNAKTLDGCDGELVVGELTAPDCFRVTSSAVMSQDGEPDFTYWVFDRWDLPDETYAMRNGALLNCRYRFGPIGVRILDNVALGSNDEVEGFAARHEADGHEGVMLRRPDTLYKMGRATVNGGELMKLKSFETAEATVTGFEEEMHNGNEATTSEVGSTVRSNHQANMTGKGTLGALVCSMVFEGKQVEFSIGSGFDAEERRWMWQNRSDLVGQQVTFRYFPLGSKERPRFPTFVGVRSPLDL